MADFFNQIVYTDSTGKEITLDQSTSVATVGASTLSVANAQEAQHAVNADHATNADNATKATADGNGNNIASTYATKSALSSGLAGKANTSGTYPNMTVGNATNATNDGSGHPILSFLKNSLTIDDLSSDADLPTQFNFASFVASIASPKGACAAAYAMTAEYDAYYSSNITASTVNGYILKVMFTDTTGVQLFAPPQSSITAKMIVTAIGDFPLSGTEFAFTALLIR